MEALSLRAKYFSWALQMLVLSRHPQDIQLVVCINSMAMHSHNLCRLRRFLRREVIWSLLFF
jgi:hypothetical protein